VEYDEGVILGADSRTTTGNSSTGINTFNDTKSKFGAITGGWNCVWFSFWNPSPTKESLFQPISQKE
jgi:hypothetical protein